MAAKILGKLKGVIASACEPSRNGRKYTEHFWDAIFDSPLFKEGIKNRVMFGCMYHPEGEAYNQIHPGDESAVCLTNVVKKGLEYIGTFDILPTRAGEVLKNLIDVGCVFGISSRGLNDYDTPIFDDPSTYDLITFDIVAFPGIKSARLHPVTAVAESYGKRKVNKTKIMENLNKLANEDEQAKEFIDNTLKAKENLEYIKNIYVDNQGYVSKDRIADYITEVYDGDLDDRYSCINSILNSFKDEDKIATEIIREFAGAHNLVDKIGESLKAKEELHTYVCDNCGFETEMTDEEYDGSCPMCHEHHGEFGRVEESVKTNEVSSHDEGYVYTYCDNCGKKNRVKVTFKGWNSPFEDTEYTCKYCGTRNLLTDSHIYDDDGYVKESAAIKEDFDTDIQVEELPDAFNEIEDKDLLQYANIVTINDEGVPYFDDGRHGRLEVVTYPEPEFIKPGEKYLVNDIWYSDITNQYIVGAGDDWLLIG